MKKILVFALLLALLVTFAACATLPNGPENPENPENGNLETEYEFGDDVSKDNDEFYSDFSAEEKDLYYTLWSENTTVSIKIDIEPTELAKISEAYEDYKNGNSAKADIYRKCNLTITVNGQDYYYEEAGIRMRGNTSRTDFANGNGEIYNYVHFRFTLKETFDGEDYEGDAWGKEAYHNWNGDKTARKARKNRTFATMSKFYYKWNKNYDQTYIREVYANRMFQAYGILAPHITLTQISMTQGGLLQNGGAMQNLGVGNLYEVVDKDFILRNFPNEKAVGDLYKCTWGSSVGADLTRYDGLYGIETATQKFTYELKTNDDREDENYRHNAYLKAFIDMLQTNKNASNFKTKLESMVDMNYFTRFEAVNYLLGNPDCIRNNANNYYLYFTYTEKDHEAETKAYIIPYDYDWCMGANNGWVPQQSMTKATPYQIYGTTECKNPLYTKTILSGGLTEYKALYKKQLQAALDGDWFNYSNYQLLYNAYKAHYASVAQPSLSIQQQCGDKIAMWRFVFSENESDNVNNNNENLSVKIYMQLKRATATANL